MGTVRKWAGASLGLFRALAQTWPETKSVIGEFVVRRFLQRGSGRAKEGNTEWKKRGGRGQELRVNLSTLVYISALSLISFLPPRLAFQVASQIGRLRYRFLGPTRARREAYIEMRLGMDPESAARCLERSFELTACEDLECWILPRLTKEKLSAVVRIQGLEHLDEALARGKGVVLYGGHIRGIYTLLVSLGLLGYHLTLYKGSRDARPFNAVARLFYERRFRLMEKKLGFSFLWIHPLYTTPLTSAKALTVLRRNDALLLLPDLRFRFPQEGDVDVEFLNDEAKFPQGPSLYARASGAPLILAWVQRPPELVPLEATLSAPLYVRGDHLSVIQQQATQIETELLKDPAAWNFWIS